MHLQSFYFVLVLTANVKFFVTINNLIFWKQNVPKKIFHGFCIIFLQKVLFVSLRKNRQLIPMQVNFKKDDQYLYFLKISSRELNLFDKNSIVILFQVSKHYNISSKCQPWTKHMKLLYLLNSFWKEPCEFDMQIKMTLFLLFCAVVFGYPHKVFGKTKENEFINASLGESTKHILISV